MKKLIEFYDPIAEKWRKCYFVGYTSRNDTVIEVVDDGNSGVVVLLNGTAQLRDVGVKQ